MHPLLSRTLLAAGLAFAAIPAAFAAYPDQPIRLVIGYEAGGTTDILARALGQELGKILHQAIVVENKGGAAGNIAAAYVQGAKPDGYTLFMATVSSHGINPALYKQNLGYDPVKGFEPISMIATIPLVLAVNTKLPVKSIADLVALARAKPGELNYASSGNGSPGDLAGAMFADDAKIKVTHVPYRGGAPANTSVIAGQTQYTFATLPGVVAMVKSGQLLALAVTTKKRSEQLPNVPTLAQTPGFSGYEINTWNALMAPAGTPQAIITKLNAAIKQAMTSPALVHQFELAGATPDTSSPAELKQFIAEQLTKWADVVNKVGIKLN